MKVYADFNHNSYGLYRIANALFEYAPDGVEFIATQSRADLVVFFVIGRHDHMLKWIADLKGTRYALIQIALASTRNPDPKDWLDIWKGAELVWSYYDLPIKDYYHAPLGADPKIFYQEKLTKDFLILTNGNTTKEESLNEVWSAAKIVDGDVCHPHGVTDEELRRFYNRCKYVSGLRRKDGFEMPVVEGLLCGTRPIVYDAPRYHQWFDGLAEFIPEDENVVTNLVDIFKKQYNPVTKDEIKETEIRFNWERIIKGFWERLL